MVTELFEVFGNRGEQRVKLSKFIVILNVVKYLFNSKVLFIQIPHYLSHEISLYFIGTCRDDIDILITLYCLLITPHLPAF